MRITIIGWYGTETIGDRAILAGIINMFSSAYNEELYVNLGSLFVPLSMRTWFEDRDFYYRVSNNQLKSFNVFYSLSKNQLEVQIRNSDILVLGGGPLLESRLMYMIKYAFAYAKKKGVKTVIIGSGWGGLKDINYINLSAEIIREADKAILRDQQSVDEFKKFVEFNDKEEPVGLVDPAFVSGYFFKKNNTLSSTDLFLSINFREMFIVDSPKVNRFTINDCVDIVDQASKLFPNHVVKLIPMHTFHIGGDDRIILNRICNIIGSKSIVVQNKPLSLEETMSIYSNSSLCIGMRFHSVLLQTLLNGRNYILDYTESGSGKIINLLNQLGLKEKYEDRYVSCENIKHIELKKDVEKITIDDSLIEFYINRYTSILQSIF